MTSSTFDLAQHSWPPPMLLDVPPNIVQHPSMCPWCFLNTPYYHPKKMTTSFNISPSLVAFPFHQFDIASHPFHVYLVLFDVFGVLLESLLSHRKKIPTSLAFFFMLPNAFYISLVLLNVSLTFP
jgi:hypothetical protein